MAQRALRVTLLPSFIYPGREFLSVSIVSLISISAWSVIQLIISIASLSDRDIVPSQMPRVSRTPRSPIAATNISIAQSCLGKSGRAWDYSILKLNISR